MMFYKEIVSPRDYHLCWRLKNKNAIVEIFNANDRVNFSLAPKIENNGNSNLFGTGFLCACKLTMAQ